MSDPFLGEVRVFACGFAPLNWALCNGQLMSITQNSALFSIIGTTYGGNGTTLFALPDFEGNVPVGAGSGPGLSPYVPGDFGGSQTVTLLDSENPIHNHALQASTTIADNASPAGNIYARGHYVDTNSGVIQLYDTGTPNIQQNPAAIGFTGGGQPHQNMMPTLAVTFCICLRGIFPSRP